MLRRSMRIVFVLVLMASVIRPIGAFAQEEPQPPESGQIMLGEPVQAPSPVADESPPDTSATELPPAELPPADLPPTELPPAELPPVELPVVTEPEIVPPAAETDSSASQPELAAETTDNAGQANEPPAETTPLANEEEPPVDAAADTVDLTMTLSCEGIVTYTGGPSSEWKITLYGTSETPNVRLDTVFLAGPGTNATAQFYVAFDWDTSISQNYLAVATANGETIGTATTGCDPYEVPEEPDDEPTVSYVSAISVTCDGAVTFTIEEAAGDTLWITLSDPRAPSMHSLLGGGSFEAIEAGTFTVSYEIEARNTVQASVSSNDHIFGSVTNCLGQGDGEEDWDGAVSSLAITCEGVASLDANNGIVGINAGLHLYGSNGSYWQSIGITPLFHSGAIRHDFEIPAGVWNTLRVEATAKYSLLAVATVTGCRDEEPEPEPVLPVVENLTVDCTGLVGFDLDTSEAVELQVWVGTGAQAPGFSRETYVTLSSGFHQVQLDIPVGRFDRHTAIVALDADEWHQLAEVSASGCRDQSQTSNTPDGSGVVVEIEGGSVEFDAVLQPGVTSITVLDPAHVPALPAGYDPGSAILLDISSTAIFEGAVTVCLPMSAELAANAEHVRMLHFESGDWVDITVSVSAETGLVCGSPNSFSPFAIVQIGSGPGPGTNPDPGPNPGPAPGEPSKPSNSGHAGGNVDPVRTGYPVAVAGVANTSSSPAMGNLPNTGSGAALGEGGDRTLPLILSIFALAFAIAVRTKSNRTRRTRSR